MTGFARQHLLRHDALRPSTSQTGLELEALEQILSAVDSTNTAMTDLKISKN